MSNPFNKFDERPVPKGRHWREAFDSRYLRVFWLSGKPRIVTITAVQSLKSSNKNESKEQLLISLAEVDKKWAANVTNCTMIEALTGKSDPTEWIGTRLELYPTKTRDPKGAIVDCIRVREQLPAAGAKTEAPKWRQEVSQYLQEMKDAVTDQTLRDIRGRIVEDNDLTGEETPVLLGAIAKRATQMGVVL